MRASIILLSIALAATALAAAPATKPATQAASETYTVKKGTLKLEVQTDSTLAALEPFEVRLKTKSYAGQFTVTSAAPHGAHVAKGDTLLDCDPRPINWAVEGAENELSTAHATLTKAEADAELAVKSDALSLRISEDNLKNSEANLKWF